MADLVADLSMLDLVHCVLMADQVVADLDGLVAPVLVADQTVAD